MSEHLIKVCVMKHSKCLCAVGALAEETSAPDRRPGNYSSHIMLVCQEKQGAWQSDHECAAHIGLNR
jgi:hypothetical protein